MTKIILIALAYIITTGFAYAANCSNQAPFGYPFLSKTNFIQVCHSAYVLDLDPDARIPAWVSYVLTPDHALGCVKRHNDFKSDTVLPVSARALPSDYAKSGYDKGHIAPDSDMSWDTSIQGESFLMSNMTPQKPNLNRITWEHLEEAVRNWAVERNDSMVIYAGPIYDIKTDAKLNNRVDIPNGFYKIIVDETTGEALAFAFPNSDSVSKSFEQYQVSISQIEKKTGISFLVPIHANKNTTPAIWQHDESDFLKAKAGKCSIQSRL